MKYIFSLLFLSLIAYSIQVQVNADVNIDLQLVHQQNTETSSPIIFEPGPVLNEIYNKPTDTSEPLILYNTNNNNNPPSSFVIEQKYHNKPNVLLPNTPLF